MVRKSPRGKKLCKREATKLLEKTIELQTKRYKPRKKYMKMKDRQWNEKSTCNMKRAISISQDVTPLYSSFFRV